MIEGRLTTLDGALDLRGWCLVLRQALAEHGVHQHVDRLSCRRVEADREALVADVGQGDGVCIFGGCIRCTWGGGGR
jgi:hypothetical protein